jgi:hypothetical protein
MSYAEAPRVMCPADDDGYLHGVIVPDESVQVECERCQRRYYIDSMGVLLQEVQR